MINALAVSGGGGETYLLNILRALSEQRTRHEYHVMFAARHKPLVPQLPPETQVIMCPGVPRHPGLRMAWEQVIVPRILRRERADILYAAYNTAALFSPVPIVLLSHNPDPYAQVQIPRNHYARARNAILRGLGRASARVARCVVFVSHTSARVMAPQMGVHPSRVRVVHHGWTGPTTTSNLMGTPELPSRYILSVSDLYPHKNLEVLLRAFAALAETSGYPGHLVLAGVPRDIALEHATFLYGLRDRLSVRDRIHFLGRVPHPSLFEVYRRADLFVFPSLYETFGLPLLEAMGCGVPVVTSDWRLAPEGEAHHFNVGPEMCGPAAEYFNPRDADQLAAVLTRVLDDPLRQADLVANGRARIQEFSWDRAATQLIDIWESAVSSSETVS